LNTNNINLNIDHRTRKRTILGDKLIIALFFCIIILLPLFTLFMHQDPYSKLEKRYLSTFPGISFQNLVNGKFGSDFENYLCDHFAFRNFSLGVNAYYNLIIGRNGSNDIYKCADGYLIEKQAKDADSLVQNNMKYINNFAKNNGYKMDMILVPSTGYILQDKLPYDAQKYEDKEAISNLKANLNSNINFIDISQVFLDNSDKQLYYKTDHHWTSTGAYLAYTEYCKANSLTPIDMNAITKEDYDGFYGTTYSRSCLWFTKPDTIEFWNYKSLKNVDYTVDGTETSIFDPSFIKKGDGYGSFLCGNNGFSTIKTGSMGGKILVIRDSFSNCFVPFLCKNYSEIYLVDLRYYKKPVKDIIEENKIDNILVLYGLNNFAQDQNVLWLK